MQILDRYIGKSIFVGVIGVMFVIVTLDAIISFAGENSDIGKGHYTSWWAIYYIVLTLPQKIYLLFPLIVLLGTIVSLGMLASHSELVAVRAAGVSIGRIAISSLKTGMILTALIIVVGEFIAPPAVQYAKLMRVAATEDFISLNTDYGLWARDSNNYIHVRSVKTDGSLVGISLYIFDNKQTMIKTVTAATGEYVGDHWLLKRVTIQDISDANIVRKGMKELRWDSLLSPDVVNVVSISPENLSIWKLRSYIDYLNDNQLDSSEYRLWFWSKLIAPFTIAAMVLLALPFVFGSLRNVGAGQRILVGFLLGLGFYIFNQLVAKLGLVYELPAVVAASLPTIVILVIAIVLLRRTR